MTIVRWYACDGCGVRSQDIGDLIKSPVNVWRRDSERGVWLDTQHRLYCAACLESRKPKEKS